MELFQRHKEIAHIQNIDVRGGDTTVCGYCCENNIIDIKQNNS